MSTKRYLEGLQSFIPSKEDNPDCVPFYRAWRGMENVVGKETMSQWHHLLHEAICWASNKPESEQFPTILQHLRYMICRWTKPEEPRYSYSWTGAPSEPTEQDARKFFNDEYKRAFPGKRANSKEANRLWEEKRAQAFSILQEQYQTRLKDYELSEQRRDAENDKRKQDYIGQFWAMAQFEEFVRQLEKQ